MDRIFKLPFFTYRLLRLIFGYWNSAAFFLLPTKIARKLSRSSDRISNTASVGFSWVNIGSLSMQEGSRIGHCNIILCDALKMDKKAAIGFMNIIVGPLSLYIKKLGQIGNRNVVSRAGKEVSWGESVLTIGINSKVTAEHKLDLCRSIKLGDNSVIAGLRSQLWTHGYVHLSTGARYRVDGSIDIGSNVYIGSSCIINGGVSISDNIAVGSGACVSKNLSLSGMYVSHQLRHIERNNDVVSDGLTRVEGNLCEHVYVKEK